MINNDQQKIDLVNFDAMVADLDAQEQAITKSQLIDAMMISLKLRKYIANPMSSIATSTADDLAYYDAMVADFNEQEVPFSKAQLIDIFCASSKLRKHIKTMDSTSLYRSCNEIMTPAAEIVTTVIVKATAASIRCNKSLQHQKTTAVTVDDDDQSLSSVGEHQKIVPIHHSADEIVIIDHPSVLLADDGAVQEERMERRRLKKEG